MEKQNDQKTPEWLRRLEEESWQAELIISGLALYGSFQLPVLIYGVIDFFIRNLPMEQYYIGYMIVYALLLGVSILSGFFIIHFVLRAYWVGLIGMNSVFPNGYNTGGGFYSKIFVKKMITILPKVTDTIQKVDKICSTLFAGAFAFLMVYGMGAFVATLFLVLYNFLLTITTPGIILPIFQFIGGIITLFIIFGMIASMKQFKENERMQNAYFIGSKYIGWFMTPIFFKQINQITMTFFSSYEKGKSNVALLIAFFMIAMTLSFSHIFNSNAKILVKKEKGDFTFFQKNKVYPEFYEASYPEDKAILNPILPSEEVTGSFLKVFIPVFNNEGFIQEKFCEPYQDDDSKSGIENLNIERAEKVFCYRKYHQIFINDSLYQVELLTHNHAIGNEFGLIAYIPTDGFRQGKNEVRTIKLETPEGKIYDELTIPFWFSKNGF